MSFKSSPEAQHRAAERLRDEQVERRADITARLLVAYRAEPDRSYAEDFYGAMLRERGVDPEGEQ